MSLVRARVDGQVAGGALHENHQGAHLLLNRRLQRANVVGGKLQHLRWDHRRMGREIDQHGNRFAGQIVKAHHGQFAIDRFRFDLRVAIAVEAIQFDGAGRHPGGHQSAVGLLDGCDNPISHLFVIANGGVKFALAFAGLIRKFEHRPMMRVRTGDERIVDC